MGEINNGEWRRAEAVLEKEKVLVSQPQDKGLAFVKNGGSFTVTGETVDKLVIDSSFCADSWKTGYFLLTYFPPQWSLI